MAVSTNATFLTNLFDPQVVGAMFDKKLIAAIKLAPLATVDTTLVGQPGDEITIPTFNYIGKATVTLEGDPITINQLTATTSRAKVKKVGNGVELTDESVLSGYGDPQGQSIKQLALSVADAIEDEMLTTMGNATLSQAVTTSGTVSVDDIADALVKFGEDIDGEKVVLISADDYAGIRKANGWIPGTEIGANAIVKGTVGMVHGCQVVVSNRITKGKAFIVKPGAIALYLKRDTLIEADRDIIHKTTVMTADKHFTTALADASKIIKLV